MAYSLVSLSDGCYENTTILINKFGIRDGKILDALEQSITSALIAKASVELRFENVDFQFYKMLHKYVFHDIYEWAGKIRNVNMSKRGVHFCPSEVIEESGNRLFEGLKGRNYLKNLSDDDFLDEFTELYCKLNCLHPFREGNGRIQRLFLSMLAAHDGRKLDFSKIDKDLFMIATIKSVSGDIFMLKDILKENMEE